MNGRLIATTKINELHPLAFRGILVFEQYSQIVDMLRRKFDENHILIFAEPVQNNANGQIDWFTANEGDVLNWAQLDAQQQEYVIARIGAIANDIEAYAAELMAQPEPLRALRGHILQLALSYPDNNCLYLAGNKPVIACWGFGPGTLGVEPKNLTKLAAAKNSAPIQLSAAISRPVANEQSTEKPIIAPAAGKPINRGWLWWLLPLLALLVLLGLLFTSFGNAPALSGHTLFNLPPIFSQNEQPDSKREINDLEKEIAELRHKLNTHIAMCVPEKPANPPISEKTPPQPQEDLVIPDKPSDTSFLTGEWLCETGLGNSQTGEPVQFSFSFDRDGKGTGVIYEQTDQCIGPTKAELSNGQLRIYLDSPKCQKTGKMYSPVNIICENTSDSSTACFGKNSDGTSWKAKFRKLK